MIQAFYMDRCHFCPSPESSKVICRSIQRKVKDFFSFFTCSMSVINDCSAYFGVATVLGQGYRRGYGSSQPLPGAWLLRGRERCYRAIGAREPSRGASASLRRVLGTVGWAVPGDAGGAGHLTTC